MALACRTGVRSPTVIAGDMRHFSLAGSGQKTAARCAEEQSVERHVVKDYHLVVSRLFGYCCLHARSRNTCARTAMHDYAVKHCPSLSCMSV